jgi:hypothetical protein
MSLSRNIAALTGAAILLASLATGASAYQCKANNTTATHIGAPRAVAAATARNAWVDKVKTSYGLPWSVWSIATGKQQSCSLTDGGYQCEVKAKPCLYVVP